MPSGLAFLALATAGAVIAAVSLVALRIGGARLAAARRLAGAAEVNVGSLLGEGPLPARALRVAGRIRCRDPLEMGGGERLVAFHRDVEVHVGGRWRSIERLRETRSFDLWDHDGSLVVDPARAAEPLVVIPKVWRGDPAELEEPHRSAAERLVERHGQANGARAVTRTINVTDRLLLLANVRREGSGQERLEPPPGGFLVTNLALADAMRLLGGRHRRLVAAAVVGLGVSIVLIAVGGVGALISAIILG